jgi:hypothetical protein
LEDYLIAPFAVYEEHGQAVQAKLAEWGRALFEAVFSAGKPGRDAYLQAREGACALALRSASPAFLSLPWELLQDPQRPTPLALELSAIDRTLVAAGAAAAVPPGEMLRVLMVIAWPAGLADVGYQMIARPLVERLAAVRGEVALEVLRPPTLEALTSQLQAAAAEGRPYHILHFDGHGTFGQTIDRAKAAALAQEIGPHAQRDGSEAAAKDEQGYKAALFIPLANPQHRQASFRA